MNYRIKPVFKCEDESKQKFKYSQCLLTISVGQEVHEGEKFATTIDLIDISFGSCIMLIDDSLQRHTMALNKQENANFFYDISLKEGDLWLERNKKYFNKLSILKEIIRWDRWLNHPAYLSKQNKIKELIQSDFYYKMAFDNTINEFLKRYIDRLQEENPFNINRARQLCFDYLLEECTAMCLWPEMQCHFEVYPSKRNQAMQETHARFVLPDFSDLLHAVGIKFKNRRQLQPQRFALIEEETEVILA